MSPVVVGERIIKAARAEHTCNLCHRTIRVGTGYRRVRMVDGPDGWIWKECPHCTAFIHLASLDALWYDDGLTHDDVRDFEPSTVSEARWWIQWKRRWTRRDGTLYPIPRETRNV
jgi:hypothetical protein